MPAITSAWARAMPTSAISLESVWLRATPTEARSRRVVARKATARNVITESLISVTTRATPRWYFCFIKEPSELEFVVERNKFYRSDARGTDGRQVDSQAWASLSRASDRRECP